MWLRPSLLLIALYSNAAALEPPVVNFDGCRATSINKGSDYQTFDPSNALNPSPSYWSTESKVDTASWTAWFKEPNDLAGLKVVWALAPKKVRLLGSSDGQNSHVILDWHDSPSHDESYTQTITFPKPESVKEIELQMQGAAHTFIGIQQVLPQAAGMPIFLLLSGLTSAESEQCVMVDNGNKVEEARVILDDCEVGLAAGDGRDAWQLTPSGQFQLAIAAPPLCIAMDENQASGPSKGSSNPFMKLKRCHDALEDSDGNSIFSPTPNSQIEIMSIKKKKCLSLSGRGPGMHDVMTEKSARVSASSVANIEHAAAKAINEEKSSYWASAGFDNAKVHNVNFEIDFGKKTAYNKVDLDWEYPPLTYSFSTSNDGVDFLEVKKVLANPLNHTVDDIGHRESRYLRITLQKPHPSLGMVQQGAKQAFVYGIRRVKILAFKVILTGDDCATAAQSADARDKWFRLPIHYFDSALATKAGSSSDDFLHAMSSTESSATALMETVSLMNKCEANVRSQMSKVDNYNIVIENLTISIEAALITSPASLKPSKTRPLLGLSPRATAKSCDQVRAGQRQVGPQDGFYFLDPPCAPTPLRTYCDMSTSVGYSYYDDPDVNSEKSSTMRLDVHCAALGLSALKLYTLKQLQSLKKVLKARNLPTAFNGIVPIAFDFACERGRCSSIYYDLGTSTDITGIVSRFIPATNLMSVDSSAFTNSVAFTGLGETDLAIVNWQENDLMGIFCSTNSFSQQTYTALLACETTASASPIFQGTLNTNFRVGCPKNCDQINEGPIYGGEDGVYSDLSSICRAAIHAGLDINEFNVALESHHVSYPSLTQNGIQSLSTTVPSQYSIRLSENPKYCPVLDIVSVLTKPRGVPPAKIALRNIQSTESDVHEAFNRGKALEASLAAHGDRMFSPPNSETQKSANHTLELTDRMFHMDANAVLSAREMIIRELVEARSIMKPIETSSGKAHGLIEEEFALSRQTAEKISRFSGQEFTRLEDLKNRELSLHERETMLSGFGEWEFKKLVEGRVDLLEAFEMFGGLSDGADQSGWRLERAVGTRKHATEDILAHSSYFEGVTQMDSADGDPFDAEMLRLKNKLFYDLDFNVSIYVQNPGDMGAVLFRASDNTNSYALLFSPSEKEAKFRLLRVRNGLIYVVGKEEQTMVTPMLRAAEWVDLRIHYKRGRVTILFGRNGQFKRLFDVYDEILPAGSIGFAILRNSGVIGFDTAIIKPCPCDRVSLPTATLKVPQPPHCVSFTETYVIDPTSLYQTLEQSEESIKPLASQSISRHWVSKGISFTGRRPGSGQWRHADNSFGRLSSLMNEKPVESRERLSLAVIKVPHRGYCTRGRVAFEFLTKDCGSNFRVGPIFNYEGPEKYQWISVESNHVRLWARDGPGALEQLDARRLERPLDFLGWHEMALFLEPDGTVSVRVNKSHFVHLNGSMRPRPSDHHEEENGAGLIGPEHVEMARFKQVENLTSVKPLIEMTTSPCEDVNMSEEKICHNLFPSKREPDGILINPKLPQCLNDFCPLCCETFHSLKKKDKQDSCSQHCSHIRTANNSSARGNKRLGNVTCPSNYHHQFQIHKHLQTSSHAEEDSSPVPLPSPRSNQLPFSRQQELIIMRR